MVKAIKLTLLALLFMASEAFAQFCPGLPPWVFDDVPSTHPFCTDITWMAERSVTLGCSAIDPNHRLYCPDSEVTRAEMAAFMHRLGDALLPLTCAAGQVMKWNGLAWACASDNIGGAGGGGTVTSVAAGTGLSASPNPIVAAGTIAVDTSYVQRRVSASCAAGSSIRAIAADGTVTCEPDDAGPTNAFVQGGNAFGTTAMLGTTDSQTLELVANGLRGLRIQPTTADPGNSLNTATPNVIGGWEVNAAFTGVIGATIGGGGGDVAGTPLFNRVTDHYGTIGGGLGNSAGDAIGTTLDRMYATVGGGRNNTASGAFSTVIGGRNNAASGGSSTVAGGYNNSASGGFSFAAGVNADASHIASFVWADNLAYPFSSNGGGTFSARATGGVRFVTDVDGTGAVTWSCETSFGSGWNCSSDRTQKQNLRRLDGQAVLDRLLAMPVYAWNPKGRNAHVNRYGPTAQDFYAAFGLGESNTMIGGQDVDGVALAALQGLNAKLEAELKARDAIIDAQARELADLRRAVESLLASSARRL